MDWVDVIVRTVAGMATLPVLYVAWCVYEDEEKKLQSKIEDLWLQFDDLSMDVLSRQATFVRVVAVKAVTIIDRVFGAKNFSFSAFSAAACICLAGIAAVLPFLLHEVEKTGLRELLTQIELAAFICAGFAYFFPSVVKGIVGVLAAVLIVALLLIPGGQFLGVGIALCIVSSMLLVAVGRWALARAARTASEGAFLGALLIFLGILPAYTSFLFGSVVLALVQGFMLGGIINAIMLVLITISAMAIPVGLFLLVVVIGLMLLLHRAAWPLTSRLLYNLPRASVVEHKTALKALSAFLIGIACTGVHGWQPVLKLLHLAA